MIQNISAASIRKPIPAIVLFIAADLRRPARLQEARHQPVPGRRHPVVTVTVDRSGRRAGRARDAGHAHRRELGRHRGRRGAHHLQRAGRRLGHHGRVRVRQGHRPRGQRRARRGDARAQRPAGQHQRAGDHALHHPGGPMLTYTVKAPGKSAGRAVLVRRQRDRQDAAHRARRRPGEARRRRRPRGRASRCAPSGSTSYGITAAEISRQLKADQRQDVPGGKATVGAHGAEHPHARPRAERRHAARHADHAADGRAVRLSDLGAVEDGVRRPDAGRLRRTASAWSRSRCCARVGSSSVDVAQQGARRRSPASAPSIPTIEVKLFSSTVEFTLESYYASVEALLLGALLAVVVVFWFLRDWRATLISAIAMPLSVIPTFYLHVVARLHAQPDHAARACRWWSASWSTTRSSRSRTSCATSAWARARCRRRSKRPTRSAWRWSRPRWPSSRCSCR